MWPTVRSFQFVTDNQALTDVLCGGARPETENKATVHMISDLFSSLIVDLGWTPRHATSDPVTWRKREFNKEADFLANYAMDRCSDFSYVGSLGAEGFGETSLMGWSDGGLRSEDGIASYGWILKSFQAGRQPQIVAARAKFLSGGAASSMQVEAAGMFSLCSAACEFIKGIVPAELSAPAMNELQHAKRRRASKLGWLL